MRLLTLAAALAGGLLTAGLAGAPAFAQSALAQAPEPLPIEAYGQLEPVRMAELAPDGKSYAMIVYDGKTEGLVVFDMDGKPIAGVNTDDVKVRGVKYASPGVVILYASDTYNAKTRISTEFEYSSAFAVILATGEVHQLLSREHDLTQFQSSLGRIIGYDEDRTEAYMPAWIDQPARSGGWTPPHFNLLRVRLKDGNVKTKAKGRETTMDWFVDAEGVVIAREDYDRDRRVYQLYVRQPNGKMEKIRERTNVDIPRSSLIGLTPDETHLVYYRSADEGLASYVLMDMKTGEFGEEVFTGPKDIADIIMDNNQHVLGVEWAGMTPTYWYFDPDLTRDVELVQSAFPDMSVTIDSMSDDTRLLLVYVEGPQYSGDYFLFNRDTKGASFVVASRPGIMPQNVVPMEVFNYTTRDGLTLDSVLTGKAGEGEAPKPLILLPHGGPRAQDVIGFDWMAQYFASRGYTVLQPNFRGSSGYGLDFAELSKGNWGGSMQDDLSDGVAALADAGLVDPERVCIVGASYGGYAALMGGATTPDLYKCVIAIAPVSDPARLVSEAMAEGGGRTNYSVRVLLDEFGLDARDYEALRAIAPAGMAANFDDPVLIIHGENDTVVPFAHAVAMRDALKAAGKSVELIELKGEDHWLTQSATRLQTLRAMDAFLKKHLPVN